MKPKITKSDRHPGWLISDGDPNHLSYALKWAVALEIALEMARQNECNKATMRLVAV
jgi:hypothetical protein